MNMKSLWSAPSIGSSSARSPAAAFRASPSENGTIESRVPCAISIGAASPFARSALGNEPLASSAVSGSQG